MSGVFRLPIDAYREFSYHHVSRSQTRRGRNSLVVMNAVVVIAYILRFRDIDSWRVRCEAQ